MGAAGRSEAGHGAGIETTLGIDLASQAANTAICVLEWSTAGARIVSLVRGRDVDGPLDDLRLVEAMLGPAMVGIDAPLGWPDAFVAAVAAPDRWPLEDERAPVEFVRRYTDRYVHAETGKVPLSVSADLIAYPAMRAQRLLRRLSERTGEAIDRSGTSGRICEVYPDTVAERFGLRETLPRRSGYKGPNGAGARSQMIAALRVAAPWLILDAAQAAACVATDDHLDALLAALCARAVQRGLTVAPSADVAETARREGWIHLPVRGALGQLTRD